MTRTLIIDMSDDLADLYDAFCKCYKDLLRELPEMPKECKACGYENPALAALQYGIFSMSQLICMADKAVNKEMKK